MSRKLNYIPVSPGPALGISGLLTTPKDFYRDGRKKAPIRIIKKIQTDVINIPNVSESFTIEEKISQGKKKIKNPKTDRWILDTSASRKRITSQESQQSSQKPSQKKMTMKKSTLKLVPAKKVTQPEHPPSPLYPDGITLDICSKYSRNEEIDLNEIQHDAPRANTNINYGKLKESERVIPGFLKYKGVPLNNIEYISRGSYGTVWKYSSDFKLKPGWQPIKSRNTGEIYYIKSGKQPQWDPPIDHNHKFYQVAVKTYKYKHDDEIKLVNFSHFYF